MFARGNFDHLGLVLGPAGVNFFLSLYGNAGRLRQAKQTNPLLSGMLDEEPGYSIWALVAPRSRLIHIGELERLPPPALNEIAARAAKVFHPNMQRLVEHSIVDSEYLTPIRNSQRPGEWGTSRAYTALGDAVHTMSPLQGQGASTAICDAHALAQAIEQYTHDPAAASIDLSSYEAGMMLRGFGAVEKAARIQKWVVSSGLTRRLFLTGLRAAGLIASVSRMTDAGTRSW